MPAKSDILFIVICSNNKIFGGLPYTTFDQKNSIISQLNPKLRTRLLASRCEVLRLVQTNPNATLGGIPVGTLPLGKGLAVGPEFDPGVTSSNGQYMQAIARYDGRLYLGMGSERLQKVRRSQHHILIISGLYGLITPEEPIQSYSCHVGYHPKISAVWQSHDLLSQLIADYITRDGISTVFDLTADDEYRQLVAWEVVRHAATGQLLHAFSNMYPGTDALISFGRLLTHLLDEPAKKLRSLKSQAKIAESNTEITFIDYPNPQSSPATIRANQKVKQETQIEPKQDVRVTYSDLIGRMRRNLLKITGDVLMLGSRDNLDFMPRVQRILEEKRGFQEYYEMLHKFNMTRNAVEYKRYEMKPSEMQALQANYDRVTQWLDVNYKGSIDYANLESLSAKL